MVLAGLFVIVFFGVSVVNPAGMFVVDPTGVFVIDPAVLFFAWLGEHSREGGKGANRVGCTRILAAFELVMYLVGMERKEEWQRVVTYRPWARVRSVLVSIGF